MKRYFSVADKNRPTDVKPIQAVDPSLRPALDSVSLALDTPKGVSSLLLNSLSDPTNPITHSNLGDRTQHYVTFARGHQVAEERVDQAKYMAFRDAKLKTQRQCQEGSDHRILSGVKVYINGYLESTTDIEMKRVVIQGGGQVLGYPSSQCTHIITARSLSGSKTHKLLNKKINNVKVVKPDWVFDSLAKGKRLPERPYSILRPNSSIGT